MNRDELKAKGLEILKDDSKATLKKLLAEVVLPYADLEVKDSTTKIDDAFWPVVKAALEKGIEAI